MSIIETGKGKILSMCATIIENGVKKTPTK